MKRIAGIVGVMCFCVPMTLGRPAAAIPPATEAARSATPTTATAPSATATPATVAPSPDTPPASSQPANHLAHQQSPYLLQHAHDPVDWYPWGDEAFARAKRENKPILLSVGYSTCHWCHVMHRESFSDAKIANAINDSFIAIKVDREERPDVDRVYMDFIQATTGSGGWPMTVFLTPDGEPFFGGTYYPPIDRGGQPGLTRVLETISQAWVKDHDKVVASARDMTEELRKAAGAAQTPDKALDVPRACDKGVIRLAKEFDASNGGFGGAPKFPQAPVLEFLLAQHDAAPADAKPLDMALLTLRAMAAGGIHDQIAGGFHRYATDAQWRVPHYEKMLYDQAELANVYVSAYQITQDPQYADAARDTLDFVLRDMTGPQGQFYGALDADSAIDSDHPQDKQEGAFYLWTRAQLDATLGKEDAELAAYQYGVADSGQCVLYAAHSISDVAQHLNATRREIEPRLQAIRAKLLAARNLRPHPAIDDKAVTAWNGMMIGALARAGATFDEPRYTQAALRAAQFLKEQLYDAASGRLCRDWRNGTRGPQGFLDDYAEAIAGMIDLYEATGEARWLMLASDLQERQDALFYDAKDGGYFGQTATGVVLLRLKDDADNAEPAANSVSARNLIRLARMTANERFSDQARRTLSLYAGTMDEFPVSLPAMLTAARLQTSADRQIVIAGPLADVGALRKIVFSTYQPRAAVLYVDGGVGQAFLASHVEELKDMHPVNGTPAVYVCDHFTCHAPVTDPVALNKLLMAR